MIRDSSYEQSNKQPQVSYKHDFINTKSKTYTHILAEEEG